jgi:hypothetical protein
MDGLKSLLEIFEGRGPVYLPKHFFSDVNQTNKQTNKQALRMVPYSPVAKPRFLTKPCKMVHLTCFYVLLVRKMC